MHSPFEAVYSFDRTHIRRISLQEYLDEEKDGSPSSSQGNGCRPLSSRDPDVEFNTKYPLRDRFGRELCVLYQILEAEVQREVRRVAEGGDHTRRSGVRLSAEIPLDDGSGNCEEDGIVDVSVSSCPRSSAAAMSPRGTGSSFSIYRDSGRNTTTGLLAPQNPHNEHHCHYQQHQQQGLPVISDDCGLAVKTQCFLSDATHPGCSHSQEDVVLQPHVQPPRRSNTASPPHFSGGGGNNNSSSNNNNVEEGEYGLCVTRITLDTTAGSDPLRFTTTRPSDLRTTKQLFLPGRTTVAVRRTIKHPNPIPRQAYGLQSETISAALVAPLVAANLEAACSCAGGFWSIDDVTPQLFPGSTVVLGECRYLVHRYYASSDVYEAYEVGEPSHSHPRSSLSSPLPLQQPENAIQILLYRWSVHAVQQDENEAHRAALGLSLAAAAVSVAGYRYTDGGLTVITMPMSYCAVPLSTVPMSARSFPMCVKLLLRMLSDLVVKRTVHGDLRWLNRIFLALRRGNCASTDMPAALMVPVHWEKLVDFSMFVDRNAGRTIPMVDDRSSGRRGERIYHGHDVSMIVNMVLENELAEELQPEQLAELQRLMMLTTEPTQVANYLIQLKNSMTVIPSDMASLQQEYEVALQCYC